MKVEYIFRKVLIVVFAIILTVWGIPKPVFASTPQQLCNIVLFAQFDPISDGNFMDGYVEEIATMCNDTDTPRSLAGYVDAISYGKTQVTSYFPQLSDGVITTYVFSGTESDYLYCQELADELIAGVTVPSDIPLDGNGDGYVDNVTVVIAGDASDSNALLWPKAFFLNGAEIGGIPVGDVNLHNSTQLFETMVTGGVGVLCHEFLHSLGYPDLYRNNRTGVPVGSWDIMASNSTFLQYPLAYQRASVSGWLDAEEISKSGTYTLAPVSSESGRRLYLLKTPLSSTEFFALEYRQQGTPYSDELDVKIYGSGLVVYRVNTEQSGNYNGTQDEIYVFRPDETELDAGEGNLSLSCYGGEGAPDSVGSLDWNAGVEDGALVYSNGMNSGIQISDISMDGESLSFSIEFADTSEAALWEELDTTVIQDTLPSQLAVSQNGVPYLLTSDGTFAEVYRIEGSELISIGSPLGSGEYMDLNVPRLVFVGETPYVLYHDYDYYLRLCRYDAQSDSWTEVYHSDFLVQYVAITAFENTLYLTYTTGTYPYALNAAAYDCTTGEISEIGSNIASNACNMSIAVINGEPIIAYRDIDEGNIPKIAVLENNSWQIAALSNNPCGTISVVSDNTTAWITPTGDSSAVYQFNGDSIISHTLPIEIVSNPLFLQPVLGGNVLYLAAVTQNPDSFSVHMLQDDQWQSIGNALAMEVVNSPSMICANGSLYCVYYTDRETSILKQIRLTHTTIAGDVNADGKFSIADCVMLQKYLLNLENLTAPQSADLTDDKVCNIFDLCVMKTMLIDSR